jgi:hypothetical protein
VPPSPVSRNRLASVSMVSNMASSPYDLARMAADDAAAARRFPRPDFYQVLSWMHASMRPETYVEIGVHGGCSLRLAQPPTVAAGIDPAPLDDGPWPVETHLFRLTSAEFFARHDLWQVLGGKGWAFALVDGLHLFEQVLEDIHNLELSAACGAILALHDTIP